MEAALIFLDKSRRHCLAVAGDGADLRFPRHLARIGSRKGLGMLRSSPQHKPITRLYGWCQGNQAKTEVTFGAPIMARRTRFRLPPFLFTS